jgi:ribosome-associated heat shock protein Hsp15
MSSLSDDEKVRLDRWLWAARMFKTRTLAVEAIDGGKVHLNGRRAKRAKTIKPGDQLRIRKGPYEYHLVVRALSVRRGPATEAEKLYEETSESRAAREQMATQMKASAPVAFRGKGRPTKKERRDISRFKRGRRD